VGTVQDVQENGFGNGMTNEDVLSKQELVRKELRAARVKAHRVRVVTKRVMKDLFGVENLWLTSPTATDVRVVGLVGEAPGLDSIHHQGRGGLGSKENSQAQKATAIRNAVAGAHRQECRKYFTFTDA